MRFLLPLRTFTLFTPLLSRKAIRRSGPRSKPSKPLNKRCRQTSRRWINPGKRPSRPATRPCNRCSRLSKPWTTTCSSVALSASPKFSVKPGKYPAPTTVKITDSTRGAIIYCTTDGWTPTTDSSRYLGPITIDSTTTLRAIAITPYHARSFVASAAYTFDKPPARPRAPQPPPAATPVTPEDLVLPQATTVHLIFASDVTSKTAEVVDKIAFTLDQDVTLIGMVLEPRGSSASGTVNQVNKSGRAGAPGELNSQVDSLTVNGTMVKLGCVASLEGQPKPPNEAILIPHSGLLALLKHGTEAMITRDTPVDATVVSDTVLVAAK